MNVRVKVPPGAIDPEFHVPPSAVDVCVTVSLLVHVTAPPTAIATGLGLYAVDERMEAPMTIDAGVPEGEGVCVGVGLVRAGVLDEELQPIDRPISSAIKTNGERILSGPTKVGPLLLTRSVPVRGQSPLPM